MATSKKIFNPSSFAKQLSPEHRIWVQAVHKALTEPDLGGFTGTIPLAKLTGGGANGSITVQDGRIQSVIQPT